MKTKWSSSVLIVTYLTIIGFLGISILVFSFTELECRLIFSLQNLAQNSLVIPFFSVITYLGDFYLWSAISLGFLLYAHHKKSSKELNLAIALGLYLILITVSTYFLKAVFARPRPNCPTITIYDIESTLSYPSGHVSRATGVFLILVGHPTPFKVVGVLVVTLLLALSRIILGAHFPTDTIGGVFLALAIQKVTTVTILRFST